jgi:hypothetical protein
VHPGAVFEYRMPEAPAAIVCGRCSGPTGWPRPAGVVGGDGVPLLHSASRGHSGLERIERRAANTVSPESLADEAELTVRGEPR